jgi:hypothetical protein
VTHILDVNVPSWTKSASERIGVQEGTNKNAIRERLRKKKEARKKQRREEAAAKIKHPNQHKNFIWSNKISK